MLIGKGRSVYVEQERGFFVFRAVDIDVQFDSGSARRFVRPLR